MVNISGLLNNLNEQDQKHFLTLRNLMRKTYLTCVNQTVGLTNYTHEDDTFLDAIDMKLQTLMHRSGRIAPKVRPMPDLMGELRSAPIQDTNLVDTPKRNMVASMLDRVAGF